MEARGQIRRIRRRENQVGADGVVKLLRFRPDVEKLFHKMGTKFSKLIYCIPKLPQ